MATTLNIQKFKLSQITPGSFCLVTAKRNTGKSTFLLDLLHHFKDSIPVAVVICGTLAGVKQYQKYVPKLMIYDNYDPSIINKVVARQEKVLEKIEQCKNPYERERMNPNVLLIMDDCSFDKKIFNSKELRMLACNGRHFRITVVLSAQYALDMPTAVRTNCDFVFALQENIRNNKERLHKNFFGVVPEFATFCEIMDRCTENYEMLVLNNLARSNVMTEQLFWYKSKIHPPFKFGAPQFWRAAQSRTAEDGNQANPPETNSKKASGVIVKKMR
jgi:hypothetical protein